MVDSARVWFTADQHWGHAKMRLPDYSNRPFASVEEMDEAMIQAWVDRVKPGDRVYHLGDFCWSSRADAILDRLPGQLFLIIGNHDSNKTIKHPRWIWAKDAAYIKVYGQKISLSHCAYETWRSAHRGSWHLHGHSHGNLPPRGRRLDVGVDAYVGRELGYAPIPFEAVQLAMSVAPFVQVDHHREREDG